MNTEKGFSSSPAAGHGSRSHGFPTEATVFFPLELSDSPSPFFSAPLPGKSEAASSNLIPGSGDTGKPHRHQHGLHQPLRHVFTSENCTLVMAQTGSTPMLHCEVGDIGEGTVSWIRRKDYHLLTVGLATYSSDDRFFTAHVRHAQDWALHIRYAQVKDAGLYECQVSTHPPTSLFVELQLVGKK
ncbi:hypothetical protein J437_LFUL012869 [Ladona fulva]|uniref:Ig-like domain-containing protein n=1 Tax=Ladona fulva TaxID=123851 RepID=A0A8K0KDE1_LADFU|nr:hypothetical protein J437_LFUL012869 [Ladona fulva]